MLRFKRALTDAPIRCRRNRAVLCGRLVFHYLCGRHSKTYYSALYAESLGDDVESQTLEIDYSVVQRCGK